MNYIVVYDSTGSILWWWLTELPIFLFGLLFVGLILQELRRKPRTAGKQRLLAALLALAIVGGLWQLGYRYHVSRHFYRYYGPYATIEGAVKNYKAFSTTGTAGEQFEVNGTPFGYVDSFQYRCFHKSAANGGPIREGLPVRISYAAQRYGNCIVKLEVAE